MVPWPRESADGKPVDEVIDFTMTRALILFVVKFLTTVHREMHIYPTYT